MLTSEAMPATLHAHEVAYKSSPGDFSEKPFRIPGVYQSIEYAVKTSALLPAWVCFQRGFFPQVWVMRRHAPYQLKWQIQYFA